jgi:hypothetical protein
MEAVMFRRLLGAAGARRASTRPVSRFNLMEQLEPRELFSTYYVSASGSDSNAGTSTSAPWKSINKVNAITFKAGDQILFAGGQTFSGNLSFNSSEKGTSSAPITVGSYGTGNAAIYAGNGNGITLSNTAGFSIKNLRVYGSGRSSNTGSGVYVANTLKYNTKLNYIRIDKVEAFNFGNTGIYVYSQYGNSGFNDVRITNSSAHDNAKNGIRVIGTGTTITAAHTNVYVGYCKAYNNTGISLLASNSGSGILVCNVSGGTIERSTAHDNGIYGTANVGIWIAACNGITIQYNESYNNKTRAKDGGGFGVDGGCTNCTLQYNYSHNNYGGGIGIFQFIDAAPFGKNVIRYNISENDGRRNNYAGIRIWSAQASGLRDVEIYNNTIYTSKATSGVASAMSIVAGTTNVHVRNNIFVSAAGVPTLNIASGQNGFLLQNNDYYTLGGGFNIKYQGSTYTSLSAFRSATGQEKINGVSTGFNVDPKFVSAGNGGTVAAASPLDRAVSAYKLQSSSTLINRGTNLKNYGLNPGTRDFYGDALPQGGAYDLGADEWRA